MSKKFFTLTILALFLAAGVAYAQLNPTAKIEGKVLDAQGAPLPGVSVEATSPKMVGKATAVTDAEGTFRLFSLPSGTYEVSFTLQGFKTLLRKDVVIQSSQTILLNVNMEQAALEEQVTVIGQSPLIDVKSTVKGQTMTKEQFMSLPRNRNFDGLLSTVPGVQYEGNTGGLSVDGATGTENMWYMDGTDITQIHIGTRAQSAVMELVEEVKVTASGYNAEFGGSMGGVVNVITRSGGNAFHGDISAYYNNNNRLMQGKARQYGRWNPLDSLEWQYVNDDDLYWQGGNARDQYQRFEGVFSLGGYILKDRLWFFGSFNPQYSSTVGNRQFLSDSLDDPKTLLNTPLYSFYNKWWVWNGQLKLTSAPVKGLRLSASFVNNFSKYRGAIPDINGTSTKDYAYKKQGYDYPNVSGAFTADYTVSNNFLVSARAGYSMQDTTNQQIANRKTTWYFSNQTSAITNPLLPDGTPNPLFDPNFATQCPILGPIGTMNYGGTWLINDRQTKEKISGNIDLTYYLSLAGEHAWKGGVQLIRDHENWLNGAPYPHVNIFWGLGYYGLATGEPVMGRYGHYEIRSGFTSTYGSVWNIHRDNWALYLQDSWTIAGRLTVNAGLRTEQEYIPSFNPEFPVKPIFFHFGDKLAPRLGLVYDVFGDSSLKVFGAFGIYYDVMKLYMAEGAFGGFKWKTDYYELNNPDFLQIARNGLLNDAASQAVSNPDPVTGPGTGNGLPNRYVGTMDWRIPSFDSTDPNLKPVSQREISFGAEKKLTEDLSLSLRLVQKHLIRTIEDTGVLTPAGEFYYNTNPGFGWSLPISQGGKFSNEFPATPKAKREYYGMNLSLEKRFSHNWQGGINYTLSRTAGNYGGLSSTDENGRNSPNVERYYDLWFMSFDIHGNVLRGPLPQDRMHYLKAYGSYAFPFGLTVGVTAYGRSGLPLTTVLNTNNVTIYPNNRADLGRLPFTFWADLYLEYTFRFGGKALAFNLQFNNVTNTKTIQGRQTGLNRISLPISDANLIAGGFDYQAALNPNNPENPDPYWRDLSFGLYNGRFGTWSTMLGARFSF